MAEWIEQLCSLFPEHRRRYAQCLRKLAYPSPADAEQVRARQQAHTHEVLRVYGPCDNCGLWHLTHRPLTAEQVRAEAAELTADIHRYNALSQAAKAKAWPYLKGYRSVCRKRPADIDADFAESWVLLQRGEDLDMAIQQRTVLLARAEATDGREAARIDRDAQRILEERGAFFARARQGMKEVHADWRQAAVEAINHRFALPTMPGVAGRAS